MSADRHALCCDCDRCMGAGLALAGAGTVRPATSAEVARAERDLQNRLLTLPEAAE